MYEERKEKFSFKSFFLTILLVLLFILLMLWIFPTKWDVNKLQSTYDLERLSVLYDEIFAANVERMKDAAIGYFTNERMPQTVGESKKLTLQQMYDLHLVLKMKDKDGNACDANKSYVEMTKYTEEYRLKVNLSCGTQEDYIIVYLGCYDYCNGGLCEKRVSTPNKTTAKEEKPQTSKPVVPKPEKPVDPEPEKPVDPEPEKPVEPKLGNIKITKKNSTTNKVLAGAGFTLYKGNNCTGTVVKSEIKTNKSGVVTFSSLAAGTYYVKESTVPANYQKPSNVCTKVVVKAGKTTSATIYNTPKPAEKKTMYEYKLVVKDVTTCSKWSNWQKQEVKPTSTKKVETKTEKEISGYTTKKVQTGTKVITTTKKVKEKYIKSYTTKLVVVDSYEEKTGQTTTKKVTERVVVDTIEKFKRINSGSKVPKDTSTLKIKKVTSYKDPSCSYCENNTMYTWEEWTVEPVYDVVTKTVTVPVYKTVYVYEQQKVPVYDYRIVEKKETKKEPVYTEVKIPQYKNVTYYRYQTCTTKKGYIDIKWSYNKNDVALIKKGYKLTGNVKKV